MVGAVTGHALRRSFAACLVPAREAVEYRVRARTEALLAAFLDRFASHLRCSFGRFEGPGRASTGTATSRMRWSNSKAEADCADRPSAGIDCTVLSADRYGGSGRIETEALAESRRQSERLHWG